jgi:hypothetical protein
MIWASSSVRGISKRAELRVTIVENKDFLKIRLLKFRVKYE